MKCATPHGTTVASYTLASLALLPVLFAAASADPETSGSALRAGAAAQDDERRAERLPDEPLHVVTEVGRLHNDVGLDLFVEAGAHVVANLGTYDPHIWLREPGSRSGKWLRPEEAETLAAALGAGRSRSDDESFVSGVAGTLVRRAGDGMLRLDLVRRDGPLAGLVVRLADDGAAQLASLLEEAAANARWIGARLDGLADERADVAHR